MAFQNGIGNERMLNCRHPHKRPVSIGYTAFFFADIVGSRESETVSSSSFPFVSLV